MRFASQFLTSIVDHMVVHWSICIVLFILDIFLFFTGKWNSFKLPNRNAPIGLTETITQVLLNQIFIAAPLLYIFVDFPEGNVLEWDNLYRIPMALGAMDILFYYSHRILHVPYLYERVHKMHHVWTGPCALAALYCHPFEMAISNVLPIIFSGMLAGLNFSTMRIWHMFILFNSLVISHGGYRISEVNMHDLHHYFRNWNYGTLGIVDRLHGTYKSG